MLARCSSLATSLILLAFVTPPAGAQLIVDEPCTFPGCRYVAASPGGESSAGFFGPFTDTQSSDNGNLAVYASLDSNVSSSGLFWARGSSIGSIHSPGPTGVAVSQVNLRFTLTAPASYAAIGSIARDPNTVVSFGLYHPDSSPVFAFGTTGPFSVSGQLPAGGPYHVGAASNVTVGPATPADSTRVARFDFVLQFLPAGSPPSFCDALDGSLMSCPCGNSGTPDSGCDIEQSTGGVSLAVLAQTTAPNAATLSGTGFPATGTPAALVIRSNALDPSSPVVFGDGLRCIATSPLVRLAATTASGGVSTHFLGHGAGPGTFYYQIWFRNTPARYCTPAGFNLSNGRVLTW